MRFVYPAVFEKKEDGTYHASFPDLEDCEADGDSLEELMKNANEAMFNWIDIELHEDDPCLPPASYPDEIHLKNDRQSVYNILVHYRMVEGWDE